MKPSRFNYRVWYDGQMIYPFCGDWDKQERWVDCIWINEGVNNFTYQHHHGDASSSASGVRLQSTGLLDKNGKEIFEGDIVMLDNPAKPCKCKVEWGECGWNAMVFTGCAMYQIGLFQRSIVIGNIYENKELLE